MDSFKSRSAEHSAATRSDEQFQRAFALHQQGRFDWAKRLYEEILAFQPDHFDTLHFLGVLSAQTNNLRLAVDLLNRAISINPDSAPAYANRGKVFQDLNQFDDALRSYDRAIELQPEDAIALNNRGNVLMVLNRPGDALQSYDRALELDPAYADAHNNRGNALRVLLRPADALHSYKRALELQPRHAAAYANIGNALRDLGRLDEALQFYDRAIELQPRDAAAHYNRGLALKDMGRLDEALHSYDRAIELRPQYAQAHNNRGNVLKNLNQLDAALQSVERAITLDPGSAEAHINRGTVLADLKRFDEALASYSRAIAVKADCAEAYASMGNLLADLKRFDDALASFDRSIALKPDYAEAYTGKAELLLLMGDFAQGWELYEWRWKSRLRKFDGRYSKYPVWSGEQPVAGKTILVRPEVGLGDFIMFSRYVPLMQARGAKVVLYAPAPLLSVLSSLGGTVDLIEEGKELPHIDFQCPIMSLPRAFRTTPATIPVDIPYLKVTPEKQTFWSKKLGKPRKRRIGLMWSGKADRNIDFNPLRSRSMPLDFLAPLLSLPHEFHSLQKETPAADREALLRFGSLESHHGELNDLSDTAALIQEMELVISIDTSVAHLAGALGANLWAMLPYLSDYRWMTSGGKPTWYPTATLFRQPAIGDWSSVVSGVRAMLTSRGI